MGEVKHTPGEWVVEDEADPMLTILAPNANGDVVAHIVDVDWLDDPAKVGPKCLANARLIAAAPCLLGALRGVMPAVEAYLMTGDAGASRLKRRVFRREIDAARAAIAKATGPDQ